MGPLVPGPWSPGPLFIPTCKSLGWENVVSPSNQVTVIVSTTNKHVHINCYGTTIGFARKCVSAQNSLCADIVLFVWILSSLHVNLRPGFLPRIFFFSVVLVRSLLAADGAWN